MPQLKAAFERAGYRGSTEEWPSEELLEVAIKAMVRHADDTEAAQHAIMRACRNDAALLRSLVLPWWRQATASLISQAQREIKQRERADMLNTAVERKAAKIVQLIDERDAREAKRERDEALAEQARLDEQHRREFRERIEAWQRTKAASLLIDEEPWWQATPARVRAFQRREAHEARFLDLVLSGVPETDDKRPISHYRRPEEVDALWDQARENGGSK